MAWWWWCHCPGTTLSAGTTGLNRDLIALIGIFNRGRWGVVISGVLKTLELAGNQVTVPQVNVRDRCWWRAPSCATCYSGLLARALLRILKPS